MDATKEQAEEIYCAALEIHDQGQRVAYVEKSCSENAELRNLVEKMFAVQPEVEKFFSSAIPGPEGLAGISAGVIEATAEMEPGEQIGPYKLLERLGEGGCGVVYLAEQVAPVRRHVALKLIKLGMDTKSVIARFEAERQALALMDHPNIARVLDAGATDSGRPYFVMELVRGVRITRYCDQERLSTSDRLNLFIQVCLAIQHAHQKGIIHRDIKPSNVLITIVDDAPVPKVIDFGIAKATSGQLLGDNTVFTVQDQFMGTPAYMSPEQAALSGLDVDTRSDIYSLGVLLYELLTGKTPFDQEELLQSGFDEMRRTLREKDPHRPSQRLNRLETEELTQTAVQRRAEPRHLKSLLNGDLDWVVMRALEKDRARRYQSVSELAMDVRRYLNNEPVFARPPSLVYKLQKLIRRNRAAFAAGAVALLALIVGLGVSTWALFREHEARQQQIVLRREAEARANIAQAAVMLSRNRYADADQLVDKIQIPVTQPSLEAANVFRSLGSWNAIHGHWANAADHFLKLLEANQVDKSDLTDEATRDLLIAGPALIVAGDLNGYHRVVREALTRFAGTTNPVAAEQVIKISSLLPVDQSTADALAPMAVVLQRSMRPSPQLRWQTYLTAWQALALSLFEYRNGDYNQSVAWAQKSLDYRDTTPTRIAISHILLAMSFNRLHQPDRAQIELQQGREMVEANLPDDLDQIPSEGTAQTGYWCEWATAYLLIQEASKAMLSERQ